MRPCNSKRQQEHIVAPEPPPPSQVLPEELISEILLRLPVKSLVRFKSVCKSWNSLISDRQFVYLHLDRSSAKSFEFAQLRLLFSCKIDDSDRTFAASCSVSSFIQNPSPNLAAQSDLFELKDNCRVFGSCNGLISLVSSTTEGDMSVRLWNPATGSISPKSPPMLFSGTICKCSNFGFGYDCLTDTYKVVMCFVRNFAQVYSLSDNSWRFIQPLPAFPNLRHGPEDGVYLCGTLNWVACDEFGSTQFHIVSLDLGKDTYTRLSMPDKYRGTGPLLGVLRGFLCVSDEEQNNFVIWQMNKFGVEESWTRLVNVSYDHLGPSGFSDSHLGMNVLCRSENDDILMLSYSDHSQAILYNRRDNRLQHIELPNNIPCSSHVKYYLESLVSPF